MDKRQTNAPGATSSGGSADLAQARRGRAEVAAKLEQETDEEDRRYYALVIAEWDKYIVRLEAKHETA